MAQILTKQVELPKFNLPAPYNDDVWYIMEWDYYKMSTSEQQKNWIARSNVMDNKMDFSLCKNPIIREESKYFCYLLISEKKITLGVFAEYADKFKLFFAYVNDRSFNTVIDIDTADYEAYISKSHKVMTDNGSSLIGKDIVPMKKKNRLITFVNYLKKTIYDFIENSKPLLEKDIWRKDDIKTDVVDIGHERNLVFSTINQPLMKEAAKNFILFKLTSITFGVAAGYLNSIKIFCEWLYVYDDGIKSFAEVTRDIIEDYFCFLRVESDFSQHKINKNILDLSVMFEYGLMSDDERFPAIPLILSSDHVFKTVRRRKFYTAEEIEGIFSIIPFIPKVYGRILLVLHHCGMRISEILHLSIDCLYFSDGVPCLKLYMYKTERNNNIPLSDGVYKIISKEIERNKKKFPDAKYVFLNKNGTVIQYHAFIKNIKTALVEHNVLGRDGQPLVFGTHRFRATKATDLISLGVEPRKAADILGVKSLATLSYYAAATQTSVSEHMQEYLRRESILINSIGKMDVFPLEDYENAIPLCNGWCCRPTDFGICDRVNACLTCSQFRPSAKHLLSYKLQLSEIESTIAVAKANGYDRIVDKCISEKKALEDIIKRLEEMLNEQKHETNGKL